MYKFLLIYLLSETPHTLLLSEFPLTIPPLGFSGGSSGKEPACQCRRQKRLGFYPWVGKIPQRRAWQPTLVFLPGESHGHMSLMEGLKESGTTEVTEHTCILPPSEFLSPTSQNSPSSTFSQNSLSPSFSQESLTSSLTQISLSLYFSQNFLTQNSHLVSFSENFLSPDLTQNSLT